MRIHTVFQIVNTGTSFSGHLRVGMKMSQVGSVGSSLNQRVEDSLSIISDALTQYR